LTKNQLLNQTIDKQNIQGKQQIPNPGLSKRLGLTKQNRDGHKQVESVMFNHFEIFSISEINDMMHQ
jgi:hypothetical protein